MHEGMHEGMDKESHEQRHRQARMDEILDELHQLAEPLAGVLDLNDPDDEKILDYFDRVIEALEDRSHSAGR